MRQRSILQGADIEPNRALPSESLRLTTLACVRTRGAHGRSLAPRLARIAKDRAVHCCPKTSIPVWLQLFDSLGHF